MVGVDDEVGVGVRVEGVDVQLGGGNDKGDGAVGGGVINSLR